MSDKGPIRLLETSTGELCAGTGIEVIGLEFEVEGEVLNFQIGASSSDAGLCDIVGPARMICDEISEVVTESVKSNGGEIPCGKGCCACCRHFVSLSVPEVLKLNEDIESMSEGQKYLLRLLFVEVSEKILKNALPVDLCDQGNWNDRLGSISRWYQSLDILCPFNVGDICEIYSARPTACREHCVVGSSSACGSKTDKSVVVSVPVRMGNALGLLANELEGGGVEAVLLPLSVAWYDINKDRGQRRWPAKMMAERFASIVKVLADCSVSGASRDI